ncbi:ACT domain-containing protein [Corynebacterium sp. UBA2622]|uniref:ACT domain-containing protein n=1 Tax=Corynebacterium sp. UBA2622 TaxID=1946393 RepID=UPI0025C34EF2|nr:ACT domain-containing protein [Corynebacterium sp. UBA2622]
MHAIITTTGQDRVGIIAGVSGAAAERNLNILDVSQTLMDEFFTMIMRVEIPGDHVDLAELQEHLASVGERLGVVVRIQSTDLFTAMNEI